MSKNIISAEVELPAKDLQDDIDFYQSELGFRLELIYPSDDPAVAVISGHGLRLRLDRNSKNAPGILYLTVAKAPEGRDQELIASNGTRIKFIQQQLSPTIPATSHRFQVKRIADSEPWIIGRAGMLYRDLIDERLGGSIIASHIRIPVGGPVPDQVHFHTIGFQLIYCLSGWVRLVYEDQGEPFLLEAGDCVTQPPKIRHRVLEASDNLEVLEICVPAEHLTSIDHEMTLPTGRNLPEREFDGQVFCHHRSGNAHWQATKDNHWMLADTGVFAATRGVAAVNVYKLPAVSSGQIHDSPRQLTAAADIDFMLITKGSMTLSPANNSSATADFPVADNSESTSQTLSQGDALVAPPGFALDISDCSDDLMFVNVQVF